MNMILLEMLEEVPRNVYKLNAGNMPYFKPDQQKMIAPQIAHYLRDLLRQYEPFVLKEYLILPYIFNLAQFFQCGINDLFEALCELKRQYYYYELHGLDGTLKLKGPMLRKIITKK